MELVKTNEKIIIWMHRNNITGQQIANEMGITRQAWSSILKSNIFKINHLTTLMRMGFKD